MTYSTRTASADNCWITSTAKASTKPTEVQIASLPLLLEDVGSGPNLITIAPTGSGKTLSYLVPLIESIRHIHKQADQTAGRHVRALILAPTQELVNQIVNEGRKLCTKTGVTITTMRKGMNLVDAQEGGSVVEAEEGAKSASPAGSDQPAVKSDILVTTPLAILNGAGD